MASTYLTRTSGSPTSALKWTFSAWIKNSQVGTGTFILDFNTDTNNRSQIGFESDGKLTVYEKVSGSTSQLFQTNRLFRDLSAWYHIVVSCDRTLGTASDRTKIYVNGVRETSFSASDNPAQNTNGIINTAVNTLIGKYSQSGVYFNGLLSHVHFVDGTAYDASTFGSTDNTTGEWKINTSPSITMGTNGFTILKDGNTITDQSSNSNNFTVGGGTLTKTEDCPSNVFGTLNALDRHRQNTADLSPSLFNGNTTFNTADNNSWKLYARSTIGVTSGKYYWEMKRTTNSAFIIGICYQNYFYDATAVAHWDQDAYLACSFQEKGNGNYEFAGKSGDGGIADTSVSSSDGQILGFALDMDNYALYAHLNGTYFAVSGVTGVPTSGASKTGSLLSSFTSGGLPYVNSGEPVFPFCADINGSGNCRVDANFGNGYFGTTAVSSAGTNASGNGIFEYDVPTGFTALSTKGLNL